MSRMFLTYVYYGIKKKLQKKSLILTEMIVSFLLIAALPPIAALATQETSRAEKFCVAIVDEEQSFYTQLFISQVLTSPSIQDNLDVVIAGGDEAEKMLKRNEIAGMIVIPAIFTKNMQSGVFTPLELHLNANMPLQSRLIEEGMKSGAHLMSTVQNALFTVYAYCGLMPLSDGELDGLFQIEMLSLISEALDRNEIYDREGKTPWSDLTLPEFYMIALPPFLMSLFGCVIIISFASDEENNVNNRLTLTRKSKFFITCGNVAASSVTLFFQGALVFLPLHFFGARYFNLLPMVFLITLQINFSNMILALLIKNSGAACLTSVVLSVIQGLASDTLIPVHFLPSFFPERIKYFTLNYWWQRSLISLYASDTACACAGAILTVIIMACIMKGIGKYDSLHLFNKRRA